MGRQCADLKTWSLLKSTQDEIFRSRLHIYYKGHYTQSLADVIKIIHLEDDLLKTSVQQYNSLTGVSKRSQARFKKQGVKVGNVEEQNMSPGFKVCVENIVAM